MQVALTPWILAASTAPGSINRSDYFGDRRFRIKLISEKLLKLVKIRPLSGSSLLPDSAKAGKFALPEIEKFQKKYDLPTPQLRRVGPSRLYEFPDDKEVCFGSLPAYLRESSKTKKAEPVSQPVFSRFTSATVLR
jgi:hypothetical protein